MAFDPIVIDRAQLTPERRDYTGLVAYYHGVLAVGLAGMDENLAHASASSSRADEFRREADQQGAQLDRPMIAARTSLNDLGTWEYLGAYYQTDINADDANRAAGNLAPAPEDAIQQQLDRMADNVPDWGNHVPPDIIKDPRVPVLD